MALSLLDEIVRKIESLSQEQQRRVLDFVQSIDRPQGEPGDILLESVRRLQFDPQSLAEMEAAIEEDCERIDWDEWDLPAGH